MRRIHRRPLPARVPGRLRRAAPRSTAGLVPGWIALLAAATPGCTPAEPAPETILFNGRISTLAEGVGPATALAVSGERVLAVGPDREIVALQGPQTRTIDLEGRRVIPGLGDNHYHGIGGGPGVDLKEARSIDDVIRAIAERAAETPQGDVIVTNSDWHEGQLRESRLPLRDDLDRATTDHPVVVVRGGHEYVLNTAALEHWGIDASTPDPPGGRIGRDPTGRPDGELVDRAKDLVTLPPRPTPDFEEHLSALEAEHAVLNGLGLTSVRYPGASPEHHRALRELERRGRLTVRANVLFRLPGSTEPADVGTTVASWGVASDEGDDWVRVGGVKLGVDGGFEGGLMREPYQEPWGRGGTFRGLQTVPTDRYRGVVLALNGLGWRVATHAVGDAAIDLVLDAYEGADRERPIRGRRWVVEHGFLPRPDHYPRMLALGVLASVQDHLHVAAPSLVGYWGQDRAARVTPVREYLDAGIPTSSGTDSPVIPYNPFWTLRHFTTRETLSGGVMGPEHAVSREEALRLATTGYAYLTFEEDRKGTLAPGMLADLAVLSDDYFSVADGEIEGLRSVLTIVGGRIVHQAR